MERQNFEGEFKDVFRDAKLNPSQNVWNNIELELEREQGKKMKRRVLFYQLVAAASITFAVLIAGVGYYAVKKLENNVVAGNNSVPSTQHELNHSPIAGDKIDASAMADSDQNNDENISAKDVNQKPGTEPTTIAKAPDITVHNKNGGSLVSGKGDKQGLDKTSSGNPGRNNDSSISDNRLNPGITSGNAIAGLMGDESRKLPAIVETKPIRPSFNHTEASADADPVALMLARLDDRERELSGSKSKEKENRNKESERLWTSLGVAAGGFSGQSTMSNSRTMFALNNAVESQSKASGVAYSVGFSMGTKLAERLVIQGGVNYLTNTSSYTANQVVRAENLRDFKPATISDLRAAETSLFANNTVIPTAPHSVNSSLEFISVPVQAGYLLLDRRFGVQFNAGVSTDFFLQNTINPEGSDLKSTTQDRGADSPYRSTNFSGLMSTEFTYRIGHHYRLAVNPGLRYPLNSIYKDETGIDATPLTFDVGLRFRYIFK